MQRGQIRNVYPGGNTACGFYSFYDSVLEGLRRVIIIKGGPGTGKSTLIRRIGLEMVERGYDVEFLHCSSDNRSLDGVVIPAIRVAVVDGTAPHVIDPRFPGAVDEIVNLGDYWDEECLRQHREEIVKTTGAIGQLFQEAYRRLQEAREIEKEWEAFNAAAMDKERMQAVEEELVRQVFPDAPQVRDFFAGALTPEGIVSFMEGLTEGCERRFILKGEPGCGKSLLLQKVARKALERGYSVEIFHCAFNPHSLDMVLIPALKTAVLDGSPPHSVEGRRPGDRVIDLMQLLDAEQREEKAACLKSWEKEFKLALEEALDYIHRASELHDYLETFYVQAMDFEAVEEAQQKVLQKVLAEAERVGEA